MLKSYSGQSDGLVYYWNSSLDKILCRQYVVPQRTAQNDAIGIISKNLTALNPSPEFILDMKHYSMLVSKRGKYLNWRNAYIKMMYQLQKSHNIDIGTITKDEIYALDLPCITVARAIANGLLEEIVGFERLNSEM